MNKLDGLGHAERSKNPKTHTKLLPGRPTSGFSLPSSQQEKGELSQAEVQSQLDLLLFGDLITG
jgi:hypothetical protein